ncbi:MAG TPA: GxxExxY protein, partial [Holophagaceae bacterium]|nr:GxxExxY protein [Holophagaceae bacterium]
IIGAAIEVQKCLGPGLLEQAYEACLAHELTLRGLRVMRQVGLDLTYKGLEVPQAFRMDLVVEGSVVVELKAVESLLPEHEAQILSYLQFSSLPVGLLFNLKTAPLMPKGFRRFTRTRSGSFSASSA